VYSSLTVTNTQTQNGNYRLKTIKKDQLN